MELKDFAREMVKEARPSAIRRAVKYVTAPFRRSALAERMATKGARDIEYAAPLTAPIFGDVSKRALTRIARGKKRILRSAKVRGVDPKPIADRMKELGL